MKESVSKCYTVSSFYLHYKLSDLSKIMLTFFFSIFFESNKLQTKVSFLRNFVLTV